MNEKVDSFTPTRVIDRCWTTRWMAGSRRRSGQSSWFWLKRLRGSLLNLLSARFNEGTQALKEANADLTAINKQLKKEAETLAKAAQILADLAKQVGALNKLIGVAGSFL